MTVKINTHEKLHLLHINRFHVIVKFLEETIRSAERNHVNFTHARDLWQSWHFFKILHKALVMELVLFLIHCFWKYLYIVCVILYNRMSPLEALPQGHFHIVLSKSHHRNISTFFGNYSHEIRVSWEVIPLLQVGQTKTDQSKSVFGSSI